VTIIKGQSRESGNIEYTRRKQTKQKQSAICVGHNYAQIYTNNVNKTCAPLQTTGGKDEPEIVTDLMMIMQLSNFHQKHYAIY
jgi:hypothetical protein